MKLLPVALAALLLSSAVSAQTLTPTQTAHVVDRAGQGISSDWYLTVNWDDAAPNVGLLQFDLTGVTSVTSATLNLFHQWNSYETASFAVYRNTSAWINGATYDWSTLPSVDATPVAVLNLVAGEYGQNETYSLDVTSAVAGWVNGSYANYGFTFARTDAPNPFLYFQGGVGQDHPATLQINAVPEPSTYAFMIGGIALLGLRARRRAA
ncbi:DNRLRE domain-containing protein [Roseateles paludis]|jgi:hypothetical protein|uniref:DNRLRE domain-containing protein n=1 Tax=Roseateles paludis TaxID=3145238 RepID=A0ABV0FZ36_9BURK